MMKGQQAIGTLFIFIALVITAALAAFVLVSTTNALQSKSVAVANQTMNKATMGFSARQVEGISHANNQISEILMGVELAPGSGVIDLNDAKIIWTANGGKVYGEYEYNSTLVDFNAATLSFSPALISGKYYVVKNRTSGDDDQFLESGEVYVLAFQLPQPLLKGQDWSITMRAPYTQDLYITGYAPPVIEANTIVTLKSA